MRIDEIRLSNANEGDFTSPIGRGRRVAPGEGLRSLVGAAPPHPICFANRPLPAGERGPKETPMTKHVEVMELVARLKAAEETFVLATVVRTLSVTAATARAKAIIRPDGTIVAGGIRGRRPPRPLVPAAPRHVPRRQTPHR